jgi:hypothetical protein
MLLPKQTTGRKGLDVWHRRDVRVPNLEISHSSIGNHPQLSRLPTCSGFKKTKFNVGENNKRYRSAPCLLLFGAVSLSSLHAFSSRLTFPRSQPRHRYLGLTCEPLSSECFLFLFVQKSYCSRTTTSTCALPTHQLQLNSVCTAVTQHPRTESEGQEEVPWKTRIQCGHAIQYSRVQVLLILLKYFEVLHCFFWRFQHSHKKRKRQNVQ